jgi:putative transferase (TIGR04331 family)
MHINYQHPWQNFSKRKVAYVKVIKFYNLLMPRVSQNLNFIHSVNRPKKYWECIVGYWLMKFIIIMYSHYILSKKNKIKFNIENFKLENINGYIKDCSRESFVMYQSDEWNNFILKNFFQIKKKKLFKLKSEDIKKKFDFKKIILKTFNLVTNISNNKDDEFFIINSYLGVKNEILFQKKLNNNYKFNFPIKFNFKTSINESFRKNHITFNGKKNGFIDFIKDLIFLNMPKSFLEDFLKINSMLKKSSWPQSPSKVITASNHISDDVFKIWLAEKKLNNSKFISIQHGGGLFVRKFCDYNYYNHTNSDKIISWGSKNLDKKKFISLFNITQFNRKFKIKESAENILIPQFMPYKYVTSLASDYIFINDLNKHIKFQNEFIKKLNDKMIKNIKIRFGTPTRYFKELLPIEKNVWKKYQVNLKYEDRTEPLKNSIENSYLTIITYVTSTTLLECLSSDLPFLILSKDYKQQVSKACYKDFEDLEKAGLLHQSPSKLANLINNMKKEDFLNWWKNKKRQLIVNSFKKKYAAAAENPMYTLTKKIYNA